MSKKSRLLAIALFVFFLASWLLFKSNWRWEPTLLANRGTVRVDSSSGSDHQTTEAGFDKNVALFSHPEWMAEEYLQSFENVLREKGNIGEGRKESRTILLEWVERFPESAFAFMLSDDGNSLIPRGQSTIILKRMISIDPAKAWMEVERVANERGDGALVEYYVEALGLLDFNEAVLMVKELPDGDIYERAGMGLARVGIFEDPERLKSLLVESSDEFHLPMALATGIKLALRDSGKETPVFETAWERSLDKDILWKLQQIYNSVNSAALKSQIEAGLFAYLDGKSIEESVTLVVDSGFSMSPVWFGRLLGPRMNAGNGREIVEVLENTEELMANRDYRVKVLQAMASEDGEWLLERFETFGEAHFPYSAEDFSEGIGNWVSMRPNEAAEAVIAMEGGVLRDAAIGAVVKNLLGQYGNYENALEWTNEIEDVDLKVKMNDWARGQGIKISLSELGRAVDVDANQLSHLREIASGIENEESRNSAFSNIETFEATLKIDSED